jgi:hypothetical protein
VGDFLWQQVVGFKPMLKVRMYPFAMLTGFTPLIHHILQNTLTEVAVGAILVQFN